ncbi:MAG: FAD/NAD(P)-binding protein [Rhodospirillales bacterium]|nr:FAD/NAD(P)-binding protein [Acetobacter sp.]
MHAGTAPGTKIVAIIGGGVSGALTAFHLRWNSAATRVVVIDPRPELGLGLAYSTPSLRHLLNVPAGKISALPADPGHFLAWLRENYDPEASAMTFAPRAVFGCYVRALLSQTMGIEHLQTEVLDLQSTGNAATLTLRDGSTLHADGVVLATGNFDPAALPGIDTAAVESGAYCHNAWSEATYANLPADAPVTLIGTGLTGVDVVLRLREMGHTGTITAVSRHGVFPNRHAGYTPAERSAIPAGTPATCVSYLRVLRAAIANDMEWRAAIDSLRSTTNDLWLALPLQEQKRFRRHLQRRWDVVRHRMAPPIADIIEGELAAGSLKIVEGHLVGVSAEPAGATISLRTADGQSALRARRVINCTGPSMNYRRVGSPLIASLFAQGLAVPGPLGGGLSSTRFGALIDARGAASSVLFNLGPGRLGTLLESIAIPEIREQAVEIAAILAGRLRQRTDTFAATLATVNRNTMPVLA